jgi:gliding motility-associated-like protein
MPIGRFILMPVSRKRTILTQFKAVLLTVMFSCVLFSANALSPVDWSCIQTQGNNVVLNWKAVNDPGGTFIRYEIHSTQDGLLSSINNINTTSYTHLVVSSIKDYFILVVDNAGNSSSDTLQNSRLQLNNPGNGTAILSWNNPQKNISSPFSDKGYVFRSVNSGSFNLRDSFAFSSGQYRDTIDVCSGNFSYRINYPGNGCSFTSNIQSGFFTDKITPDIPVMSTVSVDTITGEVELSWSLNTQKDTYGYVVYKRNGAGFLIEIDTVWGRTNNLYSYVENTSDGPLTYTVAAFDSCFTSTVPPTYQTSAKGELHSSVFLNGQFNACLGAAQLSWTTYNGWGLNVTYKLFYTDSNNTWTSIPAGNSTNQVINFNLAGTYQFVVQAIHPDGRVAFSNLIEITTNEVVSATINYLSLASVEGGRVLLKHLVDDQAKVAAIAYERRQNDGSFKEIGRTQTNGPANQFYDQSAATSKVNVYRVKLVDSCGNKGQASNLVQTVFLTVDENLDENANEVKWTKYKGFDGDVIAYDLYRLIDGVKESNALTSTSASDTSYIDYFEGSEVKKSICYSVFAIEGLNSYGFHEEAGSNADCAEFEPLVFIPNAFTPYGENPIFKPVYSFMEFETYELKIFNRWAKLVYRTENPEEGWNGDLLNDGNGEAMPDVYNYTITFINEANEVKVYQGYLTLIR